MQISRLALTADSGILRLAFAPFALTADSGILRPAFAHLCKCPPSDNQQVTLQCYYENCFAFKGPPTQRGSETTGFADCPLRPSWAVPIRARLLPFHRDCWGGRSCDQSGQRDGHELGSLWKSFPSLTKGASHRRRRQCCPTPTSFSRENTKLLVPAAILQPRGKNSVKCQERGNSG